VEGRATGLCPNQTALVTVELGQGSASGFPRGSRYARPFAAEEERGGVRVHIKAHPPRRIHKALGARIRRLRQKKGLTRRQLAHLCHLRPRYLGQIERGNHNVRLLHLRKITRGLDITIERLLKGII